MSATDSQNDERLTPVDAAPSSRVDDVDGAFARWFGRSKVCHDDGTPRVVYHGTVVRPDSARVKGMGDIEVFDRLFSTRFREHSVDSVGSWFSTNPGDQGAGMYSGLYEGSVIYPVFLSIQNPHVTTFHLLERRARLLANGVDDGRRLGQAEVDAYRHWLKEAGKDGIQIIHDDYNERGSTEFKGQDVWIALEPQQIKSAIGNAGRYDPADPHILRQSNAAAASVPDRRRSRGGYSPSLLEVYLNEGADASTFPHETGHFYLDVLMDLASRPDAPADVVEDADKVLSWFGIPGLPSSVNASADRPEPSVAEASAASAQEPEQALPEVVEVDGVLRPTRNSLGQPIASTPEAVVNFWRWFGEGQLLDDEGRPVVVFRGQRRVARPDEFVLRNGRANPSFAFDPAVASVYSRDLATREYTRTSNVMPAYVTMRKPFDIESLGEVTTIEDVVGLLNWDFTVASGLGEDVPVVGYGDVADALRDLDDLAERTGARFEIKARDDSGFVMTTFDDVADYIMACGDRGDVTDIEYALMRVELDTYLIGDSHAWTALLSDLGYDGVVHMDVFDVGARYYEGDDSSLEQGEDGPVHRTCRPFDQRQVKSAIGNDGSFDADDPSILSQAAVLDRGPSSFMVDGWTAAVFNEDLGSASWLKAKREQVEAAGRDEFGVPAMMGSITGAFSRPLQLPVYLLSVLRGERAEQERVRPEALNYIREHWDEVGREPIYVEVDPFGVAWINEGNHRIMVAREKGVDTLPVVVRYFTGGQLLAGPMAPRELLQIDAWSAGRMAESVADEDSQQASKLQSEQAQEMPLSMDVDGVLRPTRNSLGQPIASTAEAVANFWRWFGDARSVDEQGRPVVLYHGTSERFDVFDVRRVGAQGRSEGAGFYFTANKDVARAYGEVMPVYVAIRNPLDYASPAFSTAQMKRLLKELAVIEAEQQGIDWRDGFLSNAIDTYGVSTLDKAVAAAVGLYLRERTALDQMGGLVGAGVPVRFVNEAMRKATGYDGFYAQGYTNSGDAENPIWVAIDPKQIKSAVSNVGDFSADNPSILAQSPLAASGVRPTQAPLVAPAQRTRLQNWLSMSLEQQRPYHERWAESVEQYVMEGRAPSVALRSVMRSLKGWLLDVYQSIRQLLVSRGASTEVDGGFAQPAYHGTPYRGIGKFNTDKIGTGEGAQAYGWGLYFAGKREIAEWYRKKLVGSARTISDFDLEFARKSAERLVASIGELEQYARDNPNDAQRVQRRLKADAAALEAARKTIAVGDAERANTGQLYEVDIPEDNDMLLWDKPLSEQSHKVRGALEQAIEMKGGRFAASAQAGDNGSLIYRNLMMQLWKGEVTEDGAQRAASELLASVGIKGIKYLDGSSRAAGEGTYNYVIFSGDDVAIRDQFYQSSLPPVGADRSEVRAVDTGKRSPITGKPIFSLLDAAGGEIEKMHIAQTADEAVGAYTRRIAMQMQGLPAVAASTAARPSVPRALPTTGWRIVRGVDFSSMDEDDGFLYHVTSFPAARSIIKEGLVPNRPRMFGASYAGHSQGRVFLTERSGVSFWKDKVEQQLFHQYDRPPAVAVVRIPRGRIAHSLVVDEVGTADARAKAYYVQGVVLRQEADSSAPSDLPPTIEVDGRQRPTVNSKGQKIAATEDGLRNFWNWFEGSKAVDAEGRPLVVFHGTDKDFSAFRVKRRGLAYYFTADAINASSYAGRSGANVMPVYLKMENPYLGGFVDQIMVDVEKADDFYPYSLARVRKWVEARVAQAFHIPSVVKAIKKLGHDGFIEIEADAEQIGVFNSRQIKSATGNAGSFDPQDPNILHQSVLHGSTHSRLQGEALRQDAIEVDGERRPTGNSKGQPIAQTAPSGVRASVKQLTQPISAEDARSILSGKTEKPGGVDPVRQIDASEGNAKVLRIGDIPLSMFEENEDGERYDGTVNIDRARQYASRGGVDAPPVLAVLSPRTGKLNIVDGGHRISAARIRGDQTIRTIVSIKPKDLDTAFVVSSPAQIKPTIGNAGVLSGDQQRLTDVAPPAPSEVLLSGGDGTADTRFVEVDGVMRPVRNSKGQLIAPTAEGVRNFWRWFGDSKSIDPEGRPLVVYHGTAISKTVFRREGGGAGVGAYFTENKGIADEYAEMDASVDGDDPICMSAYLSIRNPIIFTSGEHSQSISAAQRDAWEADGFDGVRTDYEDGVEWVAFNSTQVKSATGNNGSFNPQDPNILHQSVLHGSTHSGIKQFSMERMGSGEGARMFGWGMYFTSRPELADWYRRVGANRLHGERVSVDGVIFANVEQALQSDVFTEDERRVARDYELLDLVASAGFDDALAGFVKAAFGDDAEVARRMAERISVMPQDRGAVYEVDIPEDDVMLLWDAPLLAHPSHIQDALRLPDAPEWRLKDHPGWAKLTGEDFYRALQERFLSIKHSDRDASLYLHSLGIKGIKYLSESKAVNGEPASNYVIFAPNDMAIRREFPADQVATQAEGGMAGVGQMDNGPGLFMLVDGVMRPTRNSRGQLIHPTVEGIGNFWRWFDDSQAVDLEGRPLVMFHGTASDFDTFDPEITYSAEAIFMTPSPLAASKYASAAARKEEGSPSVMALYAKVRSAFDSSDPVLAKRLARHIADIHGDDADGIAQELLRGDWHRLESGEAQEWMRAQGFDGFYVVEGGVKNLAAFDASQVKSAIGNAGAFSADHQSITDVVLPAPSETLRSEGDSLVAEQYVEVDGVLRPARNSNGQLIADSHEDLVSFWRWFGNSTVVDASGRPLVVYHGTDAEFDEFDPEGRERNWDADYPDGAVFFTDSLDRAKYYGFHQKHVYLKIDEPISGVVEGNSPESVLDHDFTYYGKFFDGQGDGIAVEGVTPRDGKKTTTFVVFDAAQIKNARTSDSAVEAESTARVQPESLPSFVDVDGTLRPTTNSKGQPIAATAEGVRNFWRWFGDSKSIDAQGRPLVVYHTTDAPWTEFDMDKARDSAVYGKGIYLSTSGALWKEGKNTEVMALYLKSDSPLDITRPLDDQSLQMLSEYAGRKVDAVPLFTMEKRDGSVAAGAKAAGFDSIIHQGPGSTGKHIVAFAPTQIKSALGNDGTFAPQNPSILRQEAFHGTAYRDIRHFDVSRIGAGEGAQTFGWGLYFAGKQEVAEFYRKTVSSDGFLTASGAVFDPRTGLEHLNVRAVAYRGDLSAAIEVAQRMAQSQGPVAAMAARDLQVLTAIQAEGGWSLNEGQVYRVDIPDDGVMLRLDVLMGDQPQAVRAAVQESGLLAQITRSFGAITGADLYRFLADELGSDRAASMHLHELGIAGLKYPGGTIAGVPNVGFNYVVFDGADVQITGTLYQLPRDADIAGGAASVDVGGDRQGASTHVDVGGIRRPVSNSLGRPIHETMEGIRNFWKWFGNSSLVDELGRPIVFFRGESSGEGFEVFDRGATRANGFFFTRDHDIAKKYARGVEPREFYIRSDKTLNLVGGAEGEQFIRQWASAWEDWIDRESGETVDPVDCVQSGMLFDYEGDWSGERWRDLQASVEAAGFDGALLPDWDGTKGLFAAMVAFSPDQIKSATQNSGAFDSKDSRVFHQSAFHGSPYSNISRFDSSRIGSGEGAQAYGWGLYFAGKQEVAEFYREKISLDRGLFSVVSKHSGEVVDPSVPGYKHVYELLRSYRSGIRPEDVARKKEVWGRVIEEYRDRVEECRDLLNQAIDQGDDARAAAARALIQEDEARIQDIEQALLLVDDVTAQGLGRIYEVEIPDDSEMLDWDVTLDRQSEVVMQAVAGLVAAYVEPEVKVHRLLDGERIDVDHPCFQLVDQIASMGFDEVLRQAQSRVESRQKLRDGHPLKALGARDVERIESLRGRLAQTIIVEVPAVASQVTGERLYKAMARKLGDKEASAELSRLGVRGIRYLDQYSRGQISSNATFALSHCYVVFDEDDVEIVRHAPSARDLAPRFDQRVLPQPYVGDTVEVDGVVRPARNSSGHLLAQTKDGLINFWRWFGSSPAVDAQGRPLVVYHGTPRPEGLSDFVPGGVAGAALSGDAYGVASYFTTSASEASVFARGVGAVLPVYLRGDVLDLSGDLPPEHAQRLTEFAAQAMRDADRARFPAGRKVRDFDDLEAAREFFALQRQRWQERGDGMDRARPEALAEGDRFQVEYTDFDAPIEIRTAQEAHTLLQAIGFDCVADMGFDGVLIAREGGSGWFAMHRPFGNVKSALGNDGTFDPWDSSILSQVQRLAGERAQGQAMTSAWAADASTVAVGESTATASVPQLNDEIRGVMDRMLATRGQMDLVGQSQGQSVPEIERAPGFWESADSVRRLFVKQLQAVGRYGDKVNEVMGVWTQAFYAAMASRMGVLPQQMYDRYPLRVLDGAAGVVLAQSALPVARDPLEDWLALPGQCEAIGDEDGVFVADGLSRLQSAHGSVRYLWSEAGQVAAALQVMVRDGGGVGSQALATNVFTRSDRRRQGLATRLLDAAQADFPDLRFTEDRSVAGAALLDAHELRRLGNAQAGVPLMSRGSRRNEGTLGTLGTPEAFTQVVFCGDAGEVEDIFDRDPRLTGVMMSADAQAASARALSQVARPWVARSSAGRVLGRYESQTHAQWALQAVGDSAGQVNKEGGAAFVVPLVCTLRRPLVIDAQGAGLDDLVVPEEILADTIKARQNSELAAEQAASSLGRSPGDFRRRVAAIRRSAASFVRARMGRASLDQLATQARDRGYDGLVVRGPNDPFLGHACDVIVSFNPQALQPALGHALHEQVAQLAMPQPPATPIQGALGEAGAPGAPGASAEGGSGGSKSVTPSTRSAEVAARRLSAGAAESLLSRAKGRWFAQEMLSRARRHKIPAHELRCAVIDWGPMWRPQRGYVRADQAGLPYRDFFKLRNDGKVQAVRVEARLIAAQAPFVAAGEPDFGRHQDARAGDRFERLQGTAVADEQGQPLVVYHGTQRAEDFQSFAVPAYFSEDPLYASRWAAAINVIDETGREEPFPQNARVIPVLLDIRKPFDASEWDLDPQHALYDEQVLASLIEKGHDGLFWTERSGEHVYRNWVAFRSDQVVYVLSPASAPTPSSDTLDFGDDVPLMRLPARGVSSQEIAQADAAEGGASRVSVRDLQEMVDRLCQSWPAMPPVHVLESCAQAPARLREFIAFKKAERDVEGVYYKGRFYLFASNLSDIAHAEFVLLDHELGHFGLDLLLGPRRGEVMRDLYSKNESIRVKADRLIAREGLPLELAVEEVLVDIPSALLPRLQGWRGLVEAAAEWLSSRGFATLPKVLLGVSEIGLSDQAQSEMAMARLVRAARKAALGGPVEEKGESDTRPSAAAVT